MLHFYDRAGFARALTLDLDPELHRLLPERISGLAEDLIDRTEFLIVQPGDTENDIVRHIGLSPLIDPIDGHRFGEEGFVPGWDWLADRGDWFELVFTFGGDFAYVLLISDAEETLSPLRSMCRFFTAKN